MQNRYLRGLLCGIVLGALGLLAVYRMTFQSSPVVTQSPAMQPGPLASPQVPPGAHAYKFNGSEYYVMPLSEVAENSFPATR
jgi:hypothetical protein